MTGEVQPLRTVPGRGLEVLDQTLLPHDESYLVLDAVEPICEAIRSLRVRGAPLLGLVGWGAIAVAAERSDASDKALGDAAAAIKATRPTAVDLGRAVDAAMTVATATAPEAAVRRAALWQAAVAALDRRRVEDRAIGQAGAELLSHGDAVLTHCNTGALATGGIGTALGIVRTAWETGRLGRCYATETRPLLQGARLTAWELKRLGIAATLLPDTAAAALATSGRIQAVIVGADRIAANGDTANKVGTLGLALAAARAQVPLMVAAPLTTVDLSCPEGGAIPIEFRAADEVGGFGGVRWAPAGLDAYNPAFDVTPAALISAIITERGVLRPPFAPALRVAAQQAERA